MMKSVIRAIALTFVVAGATAVSLSAGPAPTAANHLSATSGLPIPFCTPGKPCGGGIK